MAKKNRKTRAEKEKAKLRSSSRNSDESKQNLKQEQEEVNVVKEIIGFVIYVAFLLLAVWFIITFVGQRTVVDGESMYDTLYDGDNLWINKFIYRFKDPERFDIVVFPMFEGTDEETYYIKRIIGLPGEKVRIDDDGVIYINDIPLEEDYGYETIEPEMIGRAGENVVLGEDEYFVMGDNRNASEDSRFELVGNLPGERLMGKAVLRMWPLLRFGKIDK